MLQDLPFLEYKDYSCYVLDNILVVQFELEYIFVEWECLGEQEEKMYKIAWVFVFQKYGQENFCLNVVHCNTRIVLQTLEKNVILRKNSSFLENSFQNWMLWNALAKWKSYLEMNLNFYFFLPIFSLICKCNFKMILVLILSFYPIDIWKWIYYNFYRP